MKLFNKKSKARRIKKIRQIVTTSIAIIVIAMIIFPFLWLVPGAWKVASDFNAVPPQWLPIDPTWENFETVLKVTSKYNFLNSMFVTAIVALIATAGSLLVNSFAAYAFARIEFPFKKLLWVLYLFPMFIPGIAILLTSINVVEKMHLTETIFVLFLPSLANAYQAFFFRQFFLGVPVAYEEAAEIDGCNRLTIFFKIFLPMSVTPMIIQGVGVFMGHWNSFLWPALTVTESEELHQVMQVINFFRSAMPREYGVAIAASLISMIPPFVIYAFAQKHIIQGVTLSGMK